ncbi:MULTISPECIES: hypothetical protein [Mycobacterium avium complex (MAC)]|uniref:Hypervirulence associated protein TUDOR domain-containing protein n=2 Tax=Mycobacterium TaxID=1763 RepID=A0A1X1XAH0_9MYCO|nr:MULTISPECIES: hypothetical protein [Mycobacterium avium complex (MAC)]ORV95832.1 hypothetical protein AWC14_17565 [Mycobacterium kyorinense]MBZ4633025.1 hypothetical protein [Mycobacterium avium subsp. hominissuis]MCV6990834.1 hypothetical protein [Mycobacterium bouchedurhonense]MCV6997384.1 hypothetical protein [Mycobacterium timonense]PBJ65686.1 hypothetical protein BB737_11605 [Mycobacterium avium subsp. hominissuis]
MTLERFTGPFAIGDRVRWESGGKGHFGTVENIIRGADGRHLLVRHGRDPLIYVHESRAEHTEMTGET